MIRTRQRFFSSSMIQQYAKKTVATSNLEKKDVAIRKANAEREKQKQQASSKQQQGHCHTSSCPCKPK